jgi:hypothetical protein
MNSIPAISFMLRTATELVPLEDGSTFPHRCEVVAMGMAMGWPETRLGIVVEEGRPILESLLFERPVTLASGKEHWVEISASAIRKIPVEEVVQSAIEHVARQVAWQQGRDPHQAAATALRTHGRRSITDELLREVAAAVREDRLDMPNQAVRARLYCSSRTASRWIAAARARGFLEENELTNNKEEH